MFAPVLKVLSTAPVLAMVGQRPRIYGSGHAPQRVATPYITWFVVSSDPYAHLSGVPGADQQLIQIDCWAGPDQSQEKVCIQLAQAVRDALDAAGHANQIILNTRDAETMFFRISFQAEFILNR